MFYRQFSAKTEQIDCQILAVSANNPLLECHSDKTNTVEHKIHDW
jgi:hypothetical protein